MACKLLHSKLLKPFRFVMFVCTLCSVVQVPSGQQSTTVVTPLPYSTGFSPPQAVISTPPPWSTVTPTPTQPSSTSTFTPLTQAATSTTTAAPIITQTTNGSDGTSFILSFPPAYPQSPSTDQSITICTKSFDDVVVGVTSSSDSSSDTYVISLSSCRTIPVPSSVRMTANDSSTWSNYLTITSSNLISVVVSLYGSSSSYVAIPDSSFGQMYYVITQAPTVGDMAMIVITGTSLLQSGLTITFAAADSNSITLCNGNSINVSGQSYVTTISLGASLCIWSKSVDFTGTRINASFPVAVVAGNIRYGTPNNKTNYVMLQMLPTTMWSMSYIFDSTTLGSAYDLLVVSNLSAFNVLVQSGTNVPRNYSATVATVGSAVVRITNQPINLYQIYASQPVMAVAYPTSMPTAMLLPGVESYRTSYSLALPVSSRLSGQYSLAVNVIGTTAPSGNLLVSGSSGVYTTNWSSLVVGNTSIRTWTATIYNINITLNPGSSSYLVVIQPSATVYFGGYVWYIDSNSAMGFPLALGPEIPLLDVSASASVWSPQAIKPAYIVLAGLGGGILLLVVISVIILCTYPITDDTPTPTTVVAAEGVGTSGTRKSNKKEKKNKTDEVGTLHNQRRSVYVVGDVEMADSVSHRTSMHNEYTSHYEYKEGHHSNNDRHDVYDKDNTELTTGAASGLGDDDDDDSETRFGTHSF